MNGTDPLAHLGAALRQYDEERMEIQADGNRQLEYVRRLTAERIALLERRRRALLGLFAAAVAGVAQETKSA